MKKEIVECESKSSIMDSIDDCILTQIFLHLPTKIQFRCKAVCNRWFRLISSSFFAQTVLASGVSSVPWYLLYQHSKDFTPRLASQHYSCESLRFNFPSGYSYCLRVYASHNGLVLCSANTRWKRSLFVCNPFTGKFVLIPRAKIDGWKVIGFMVSLNNGKTEFKVVRVTIKNAPNNALSNFEVFSSDVGEWRDTGVAFPQVVRVFGGMNGLVYDGKLIWRAEAISSSLIAYDPDKNECRVLSFNVPTSAIFKFGAIGTSCGRLCYTNYASQYGRKTLYVYILENYEKGEWGTLLTTQVRTIIDINEINWDNGWLSMMPLAFHPYDMDIVYFEININNSPEASYGEIVSFNLRTQKFISFTGGEIPKGSNLFRPMSVLVVPPWPTSVPNEIDDDFGSYLRCLFSGQDDSY